ncbi:hypothetical protein TNCV_1758051 [Trichonephila clavipes]|nr:hypothetical protein TNCV_1758051 [Trichonephila clavipes]
MTVKPVFLAAVSSALKASSIAALVLPTTSISSSNASSSMDFTKIVFQVGIPVTNHRALKLGSPVSFLWLYGGSYALITIKRLESAPPNVVYAPPN